MAPMRSASQAAAGCCLMFTLAVSGYSSPQLVEGLANLRFQADPRIFTVMAALNLAGFDLDADHLKPDSVRAIVRSRMADLKPELKERIVEFCRTRDAGEEPSQRQAKYISFALLLNGPPKFNLAVGPEELPPDARTLLGMEPLLEELWREGGLERLWEEVRPRYLAEIEAYRPLMRDMIVATLKYFHTEARVSLDHKMTFAPDLLNGYNVINARNLSHNYMVVVGPARGDGRPMRSVRHEYLHFLIDPLLAKYVGYLPDSEPFLARVREQRGALERYQNNFYLLVTESLLQMVELRLDAPPPDRETAALVEVYDQGLILAPYFEETLSRFEIGTDSLAAVFRSFIEGIQWEIERNRPDAMDRLRKQLAERTAAPAVENSPVGSAVTELRSLLSEANKLLLARQFDQARALLDKALQIDRRNAGALFGMAQIAGHAQDTDRALDLYSRAAADAGAETWIAAWAMVYRGRIFRFQGDLEKARTEWAKALELRGDLRGADEAARKDLEALLK